MRRTRPFRMWTALWLAIQLALPLGASLADANLAMRAGDGRAHVEDSTALDCPPAHGADCGICKQLSGACMISSGVAAAEGPSPASAIAAARPLPRPAAHFAAGLARAPPVFFA